MPGAGTSDVKKQQALLVGLGQIGCGYDADLPFQWNRPSSSSHILSHARALACHPGFNLVGGVDPNPAARERFSTLYDRPAYGNLATWLSAWKGSAPELVIIAVPPQLQPALVEELLSLVVPRLLLLEKPVATSLAQAHALAQSCSQHTKLLVAVNYIRRYLPAAQAWQRRLDDGCLGQLLHGKITYGKGLLSNGSHFVNLAEFWLGPLKPGLVKAAGPSCLGFDRETTLELLAERHNDAPILIQSVGTAGLRAGELDLWFQRGRLCWNNNGRRISLWVRLTPTLNDNYCNLAAEASLSSTHINHYQFHVANSLYQILLNNKSACMPCSLKEGIKTLEILTSDQLDKQA